MVEASGEAGPRGEMIFQSKHTFSSVRIEDSGEAGPRWVMIFQTKHTFSSVRIEDSGEAGPRGVMIFQTKHTCSISPDRGQWRGWSTWSNDFPNQTYL